MIRLGLVGLGAIAPYFVAAIESNPQTMLSAVCDVRQNRIKDFHDKGLRSFTDYEALLRSGAAEALVITLPNDLHFEVIAAALEDGLHVCCEKPLTVSTAQARHLAELARRADRLLMTASHRRYNANLLATRSALPDRRDIARISCRYFERIEEHAAGEQWYLDSERCGGGCIIDNGPNAIDAVRLLVGDLKVTSCRIGREVNGSEREASISLCTTDGIPVEVLLDWDYAGQLKDVTIELQDNLRICCNMLSGFPGLKGSLPHEYRGVVADFATSIESGRFDQVDVSLVEMIEQAYALGR